MKRLLKHPAGYLKPAWIELLRKQADKAEHQGQLTRGQLKLFYDQQWFKALVPKRYGGLEWDFSKVVAFEEAIGWAEGSAGWVFTLCSGAGWFGGFIEPGLAQMIFKPRNACLAGSGAVGGSACKAGRGKYRLSGSWGYATGAPHATVFTANCFLEDSGLVRALLLMAEEVNVFKSWHTVGLKATASESFKVKNIHLPKDRFFDIDPDLAFVSSPLYRTPFECLAVATIAANLSGMALNFMEAVVELWTEKAVRHAPQSASPHSKTLATDYLSHEMSLYRACMVRWQEARSGLWDCVTELEGYIKTHRKVEKFNKDELYHSRGAAVCRAGLCLADVCREIVNKLYPYTGLSGAGQNKALSRVWRDFQTGSQHALFRPE